MTNCLTRPIGTPADTVSSGAGAYSGPMTKSPSRSTGAFLPARLITVHWGASGPSMGRVGGGGHAGGAAVGAGGVAAGAWPGGVVVWATACNDIAQPQTIRTTEPVRFRIDPSFEWRPIVAE